MSERPLPPHGTGIITAGGPHVSVAVGDFGPTRRASGYITASNMGASPIRAAGDAEVYGQHRRESDPRGLEQELENKRRVIAKLEAESVQQMRTIAEMRAEDEGRRSRQSNLTRREVDAEREKASALAVELSQEREKRMAMETKLQKAENELYRMPSYEAKVVEVEKANRDRMKEVEDLRRQRSLLEQKVLELQSSNTSRMLEGKVSALQALLEDRVKEVAEESRRAATAQTKVDDLKEALGQMQKQMAVLERWKGETVVVTEQNRKDAERHEMRAAALLRDVDTNAARCQYLEAVNREAEADFERKLDELKVDIRSRAKQAAAVDSERTQLQERILVLEKYSSMQQQDFEGVVADRERLKNALGDARSQMESLEGAAARESTLASGLKEEIERQRKYIDATLKEARGAESQKVAAENRVHALEQELRRKEMAETQLDALRGTLERVEQDRAAECKRHDETKRVVLTYEERSTQHAWTARRLKDAEVEIEARAEAVDMLNDSALSAAREIEDLKSQLETETNTSRHRMAQNSASQDIVQQLETRVFEAEQELSRFHGLEGKLQGLEEVLGAKSSELSNLTHINNDLSMSHRELVGRLQEVPILEERIRSLLAERMQMQSSMDSVDDTRRDAERQAATAQAKARHLEADLADERLQNQTLEDEVLKLKKMCAEKAVLESQLGDTRSTLSVRTDELERLRIENEDLRAKQRSSEVEHTAVVRRGHELEDKLAAEMRVLEEQQLQLGKQSVTMDAADRERHRLLKDLEARSTQLETQQANVRRLQEELEVAGDKARAGENSERKQTDTINDMKRRIEDLDTRLAQVKAAHTTEIDRVHAMETQVSDMRGQIARGVVVEGKFSAMEKMQAQKEAEVTVLHQTVSDLRVKVKDMEGEVANAQKLDVRYRELRAQAVQREQAYEVLERSEAAKAAALADREKELLRATEAGRALQGDLSGEQGRRVLLERRVVDLEGEQAKKAVLDGRISGLESLLNSRSKELEGEREEGSALRVKVRALEKTVAEKDRYDDIIGNLEHEVRMKHEVVQRLEAEESRRRTYMDTQRAELEAALKDRRGSEDDAARLRTLVEDLQRTLAETRAEAESTRTILGGEIEAKVIETTNLAFTSGRMQEQIGDAVKNAEKAQERCQQLEEESWQSRRALATLEHESGVQGVALEEFRRQLDSERQAVRVMTESLSAERQRSAELDVAVRDARGQLASKDNRAQMDLRGRDEQVQRLEDAMQAMKDEVDANARRHTEGLHADAHRIQQLEASNRTLRDELQVHRQNAEDAIRGYRDLQARTQDCESAAEERIRGMSTAMVSSSTLEKKLRTECEHTAELAARLRSAGLELTELKASSAEIHHRMDIDVRELNSRVRSLAEERDALRLQVERLRSMEFDRLGMQESSSRRREMATRPSGVVLRVSPARPPSPSPQIRHSTY